MLALWYHQIMATIFAVIALTLIGVILLQRGRGGGLAGAFGGAGGHTAFGAKTGDVLTWVTVIGAILFLVYTIVLTFWFVPPPADLGTGGATDTTGGTSEQSPAGEGSGGAFRIPDAQAEPQYAHRFIFGEDRA
jgi:preprotein translocase subunit SecG